MNLPTDRVFGFSFAIVFSVISLAYWLLADRVIFWLLGLAGIFALVASLKPKLLMPLNRLWGKVTPKIALVTNMIVLGAAFCLVILPFGFVMKAIRRDPMQRSLDGKSDSYWIEASDRKNFDSYRDLF